MLHACSPSLPPPRFPPHFTVNVCTYWSSSLRWSQVHLHSRCRRRWWRKQQSQPLSIKPWSSTEPELPLNNTWLAFPIYTSPAGTQKRGCGFKHLSSSSNVSPSSRLPPDFLTQTQTWKYQEGEAVGGWCHLFQHMFVLVLKGSLIWERPFRHIEETKARVGFCWWVVWDGLKTWFD